MRAVFLARDVSPATIRALNYDPNVELLRTRAGRAQRPLAEWTRSLGSSYAAVLTRVDCERSHGMELLSQVDAFSSEPSGRWIRGDLMRFVDDLRIERGDVLIAGAGQIGEATLFGRSIIADGRLAGRLAAGDLMLIRGGGLLDDDFLYLYAFLSTSVGLRSVRSCAYGTSIPRMRPDLLARLPVPLADSRTVSRVAKLVRKTVDLRDEYSKHISAARGVIENLPEMLEAREMCAMRKARCVVWQGELPSLAAWNVASAGGALAYLRRRWSSNIAEQSVDGGIFFGNLRKRSPSSPGHGYKLISQRDLHLIRPFPVWIQNPSVDHATVFSPVGSIAMAGVGGTGEGDTLGRPVHVDHQLSQFALTQHVLRIVPKDMFSESLYSYLSTFVGRRLILTTAAGTIVQQLRRDLVAKLPAPVLERAQAEQVVGFHRAAFSSLHRSMEAEDEAIRIIEEEVLAQWLG